MASLAKIGLAALGISILIGVLSTPAIRAQDASSATPKFDVASVKRCPADVRWGAGAEFAPGRLNTGCLPLVALDSIGLIQQAYVRFAGGQLHSAEVLPVEGGPDWLRTDLYRIEATAEGMPRTELMRGPMLQALLEERFGLRVHRDVHPGPVYALAVAKGGSRLKPFAEGSCVSIAPGGTPPELPSGKRYCISRISMMPPSVDTDGGSIGEFARLLSIFLDRPVIDRTGIAGRFDFHLAFAADDATPGLNGSSPYAPAPAPDANRASIFTAIQEQLGLRLQAATGPVESLIVDHVERPSEN